MDKSADNFSKTAVCDVHGVINLDALSTFFTQLSQQINQQNQTISNMQVTMNSLLKIVDFEDAFKKVNIAISGLEKKFSLVHEAATSHVKDER